MQKAIEELTELKNLISGDIEVNLNKAEAISDSLFMDLFPNSHPNIEDFQLNFTHYATLAASRETGGRLKVLSKGKRQSLRTH